MRVGIIGLGRMGEGMSRRMMKQEIEVWGYRRNYEKAQELYENGGVDGVTVDIATLCSTVKERGPGIFMMVVPAETVEDTLNELLQFCSEGDIIIDHGNSNFTDSRKRAERLSKLGIQYIDCGTSGGVYGLDRGYCLMVGGTDTAVSVCAPIFRALAPGIGAAPRTDPTSRATSAEYGWLHCGPPGAGHFVKMVHNGIEYGIMQAIAEGFNLMDKHRFKPDLARVAEVYNHGSVITSSLVEWLGDGFEQRGVKLKGASSTVAHSGEGAWTVKTAKEMKMKVQVKVIEEALNFRKRSAKNPGYTGKVLTALREQFGGHSAK